jgi:hypothetical protein
VKAKATDRKVDDRFSRGVIARIDAERAKRADIVVIEREVRARRVAPRQRRRRSDAKISAAHLRAIYTLHREGGISLARIAKEVYERFGYSSWRSCYSAIWRGLYRDLRYPREQRAATRLAVETHGHTSAGSDTRDYWRDWRRRRGIGVHRCRGRKTRGGAPCQRWALKGGAFCGAHDPDRRTTWGQGLLSRRTA